MGAVIGKSKEKKPDLNENQALSNHPGVDERNKPTNFEPVLPNTANIAKENEVKPKVEPVIDPQIEKLIKEGLMFGDKVDAVKKVSQPFP